MAEPRKNSKKPNPAAFSVKIPPELLEKARKKSAETGVPISFVIRKAIEQWVGEDIERRKKGSG
jgi:predicted DNA-binding protein